MNALYMYILLSGSPVGINSFLNSDAFQYSDFMPFIALNI